MTSITVFMARYFGFMAVLMAAFFVHMSSRLRGQVLDADEKRITAGVFAAVVLFIVGFSVLAWEFYTL